MQILNIQAQVRSISYHFDLNNGAITPIIHFTAPIALGQDCILPYVELPKIQQIKTRYLGPDDIIRITVPKEASLPACLELLESRSLENRVDLFKQTCPVCGAPLIIDEQHPFGQCVNRNCSAQMNRNITTMLAALGIIFKPPLRLVLDYLLTRNNFISPVDIFKLEVDDYSTELDIQDIRDFQTTIHSVRSFVSINQLIDALAVPGWGIKESIAFRKVFAEQKLPLSSITLFLSRSGYNLIPSLDWTEWDKMISLPSNRAYITELAQILEK